VLFAVILHIVILDVSAQMLSDKTGLKTRHDVVVDGRTYTIEVVANFDVRDVSLRDGELVFDIVSSLSNNFAEMQIPHNVTMGASKFYINDQELSPKVLRNERISFVTLEFDGNGTHTLRISGDSEQTIAEPDVSEEQEDPASLYMMLVMIAAIAAIMTMMYNKRRTKQSTDNAS